MALIGRYNVISKSPGRWMSGTSISSDKSAMGLNGSNRNRYQHFSKYNATPSGYSPGYTSIPAQTDGGLASFVPLSATLSTSSSSLVSGINAVGSLTAVVSITQAKLDQIVGLIASISATLSTTNAQLAAVANLLANTIQAQGTITTSQLGAVVYLVASIQGQGTLSAANFATANIGASISSITPLSPEALSAAVWNATASSFNAPTTMGSKLNSAGAASDPWASVIESGYTAAEVMKILLSVAAGKTTITPTGGSTATVAFRDLADTKDRISASMNNSTRSSVTIDPT